MVSIFGSWFNKENVAPESPNTSRKTESKPEPQSKVNRTFLDKMAMFVSGDELDSIKFYDRFREDQNNKGEVVVVAEKYNNSLTFNKKQLNEIIKMAKNHLKSSNSTDVSFKFGDNLFDARSVMRKGEDYLKIYMRTENYIAGGGGGRINESTKISTGAPSVEKVGYDQDAFNNEVAVLDVVHERLESEKDEWRERFPLAFRMTKDGDYKCVVLSPKPAFVNHEENRYQMKRFEGDLVHHFEKISKLSDPQKQLKEKNKVAKDIITSVVLLHELGMVHKDIKMPNFLVDTNGRTLLADFGEAKALEYPSSSEDLPDLATIEHTFGTAEYTSIDLMRQLEEDVKNNDRERYNYNLTRLDNYSLGVVLYELYTGEAPYETSVEKAQAFKLGDSKVVAKSLREGILESPSFKEKVPAELQPYIGALLHGYPIDNKDIYFLASNL